MNTTTTTEQTSNAQRASSKRSNRRTFPRFRLAASVQYCIVASFCFRPHAAIERATTSFNTVVSTAIRKIAPHARQQQIYKQGGG